MSRGSTASTRLLALVLVSGASALVYEVLWIRALGRHFGTTVPAVSTVLAAFMGGMALGGLLFGSLADRSSRPFRLYARLELGVALTACGVSLLLLRGDTFVAALARFAAGAGAFEGAVRVAIFVLLLLGPSTMIGGTLPVLARAVVATGYSGRTVGALYAFNTAGAVLGVLAPDFALIPSFGLTATAIAAGASNAVVAVCARAFDRGDAPVVSEAAVGNPSGAGTALVLYGVSGFCAMAAEVLWSRTLSHWSASLVASFSVLLAVFLAALALGAAATRRLADRAAHPLAWGAATLGLTGVAVLVPIATAEPWRLWQRAWWPRVGDMRYGMGYEAVNALAHALFLQAPACLFMGAGLPFLAAAAVRAEGAGRLAARLFAVNTVAGVLGSLAAGFVWLPSLGETWSFSLVALLATAGAAMVAWRLERSWPRRAALACLPAVVTVAVTLPADHLHRAHFKGDGHLLAVREGTTTTAAVAQHFEFGMPAYRELLTPGVSMSDTSFSARRYMALMGHLGAFFAARSERALLICYGVGNTAQALSSHPGLALDVVDIADEVLGFSAAFHASDPLASPTTKVFVDDGRHHLLVRGEAYDVITSEPPPPNHAGVVNLYSREYYRIARAHLRPGGVITQWLPVFQLSRTDVEAIVAAFVAELPYAGLFYGQGLQWILVGSDRPLTIDDARWTERAALPRVADDLAAIGVDSVVDLYATWLLDDAEVRAFARGKAPLTDDRPTIQYPRTSVRGEIPIARPPRSEPRVFAAMTPAPTGSLRTRIANAVAATDAVYASLGRLAADTPERLAASFILPLADVLPVESGTEAILDLAGVERGRVARAEALLRARPDAWALLERTPETVDSTQARERAALEDAVLTLAARAHLLGHSADAVQMLRRMRPSPTRAELHALWLGAASAPQR